MNIEDLTEIVHIVTMLGDVGAPDSVFSMQRHKARLEVICKADAIPALVAAGAKWSDWYGSASRVQRELKLQLGGVHFLVFESCYVEVTKDAEPSDESTVEAVGGS
jgi:hypothetical protein